MDNLGPGASLWQLKLAQLRVKKKVEERQREIEELTKERVRLEQLESTAAALPALPAVGNNPASPTAPASFPVGALDALGAFNDFDDVGDISVFDECYALDTVANVADTTAATATADPPAVLLDGPDYSTLVAAAASLPTAPSVTPAAPDAASPPAATLTTLAFLALVALHATLAADSSAAAIVPRTAAKDANSPTETPDALPPPLPIVATTASKTNSAVRPADVTTVVSPAAAQDISVDMAPPAKRQRTDLLYDDSGNLVTRANLSKVFGPFPFLPLSRVCVFYQRIFRCPLVPDVGDLGALSQTLERMDGFRLLPVQVGGTDSDRTANLSILRRDGPELAKLRKETMIRLRKPKGYGSPIPAPLLCSSLAMMGCIPIGHLSPTVLTSIFQTLTGRVLGPLRVVSVTGIHQMSTRNPCEMVRDWLNDLCQYIMEGGSARSILVEAATCHNVFMGMCFARGDVRTNLDPTGTVAKEMLDKDLHHSRILLGISKGDLKIILMYLPDLMEGEGEALAQRLKELADSLLTQP
ncbi:hypothetical protein GGI01_003607 [Coemansia sp. RSA 376]|nr:hypothetical protein GGI01_003607 [Coemansia sp. RSA 376]